MARPLLLELRLRKPCCRLRRIFDGWYCRFIKSVLFVRAGNARPADAKSPVNGARKSNSERFGVKRGKTEKNPKTEARNSKEIPNSNNHSQPEGRSVPRLRASAGLYPRFLTFLTCIVIEFSCAVWQA